MTAVVWQGKEEAYTNKAIFSFSISMLFKEEVILIAVCSAIAILFIVLIITCRYPRPSTPLPSIQPLAHHRVQLLEQLQNPSTVSLLQQPIIPSTTSKPLPPDPTSKHLSPGSHSATSCSTKNSHVRPGYGVPHGPLSRIEIVLPVPLALTPGVATKSTIADRWASVGTGR